ncbi:hypothetical protein PEDI_46950 [Persicobacter diffluens]|uniref:Alginate lyase domain-containing protein n=2 Tax=Persicobacter diffluens TaxID=981 RepID=A0AAN4W3U6_9BACT|nr:hypothetical protein PEDI_46950 [Persicobacter diffluens]
MLVLSAKAEKVSLSIRPTIMIERSDAETIYQYIKQHPQAKWAFDQEVLIAKKVLSLSPQPVKAIYYEGKVDHDPKRVACKKKLKDAEKMQSLLYAFLATKDPRFLSKSKEYILAWAKEFEPTGNPINENKLTPFLTSYYFFRSDFKADEQKIIDAWVLKLGTLNSQFGKKEMGNWKSKRLKISAMAGTILGNKTLLTYANEGIQEYIDKNLYADGRSFDMVYRDAMSYHCGGMKPLLSTLLCLPEQKNYWYNYQNADGGSVKKSVRYILPYARKEKVYPQWVNSKVKFDRIRYEKGDQHYKPGTPWRPEKGMSVFEYAQFFEPEFKDIILNLKVPSTELSVESILAEVMRKNS